MLAVAVYHVWLMYVMRNRYRQQWIELLKHLVVLTFWSTMPVPYSSLVP